MREFAGMEKTLAETYSGRVIYELMQNADDCDSTKFNVFSKGNDLYVLNDGHPFTSDDLESLCRSTISNKIRSHNIGYRGIGFKSVASICKGVTLISGSLEICFSRERTKALLRDAVNVPLLRVPHWGVQNVEILRDVRSELNSFDFTTCFVLHDVNHGLIRTDAENIDKYSVVFLRSLVDISIELEHQTKTFSSDSFKEINNSLAGSLITKQRTVTTQISTDASLESESRDLIRVWSFTEEVANASSTSPTNENWIEICTDVVNGAPIRLSPDNANVHVFLPMRTVSGLGGRLNGDFDTDPSRTRLCLDQSTLNCIETLVSLCSALIRRLSNGTISGDQKDLLSLLIPYASTKFLDGIRPESLAMLIKENLTGRSDVDINRFMIPVNWVDSDLANVLCCDKGLVLLSFDDVATDDLNAFFGYLGAKELALKQVFRVIRSNQITHRSACHLTIEVFKTSELSKQFFSLDSGMLADTPFIPCKGNKVSTPNQLNLNEDFEIDTSWLSSMLRVEIRSIRQLQFLNHAGVSFSQLPIDLRSYEKDAIKKRFRPLTDYLESLNVIGSTNDLGSASTAAKSDVVNGQNREAYSDSTKAIRDTDQMQAPKPEWRNMEEFAASFLKRKGYDVKDVSLRNVGYDLECTRDGKMICVEVKKLAKRFDEFLITDNELHVARDKGSRYWVMLVVQPNPGLPPTHIAILKNFCANHKTDRRVAKYENFLKEYNASFEAIS